jgi:hypothetical protein
MGLLDKVKENIQETATMAREGVEDLQTKRELGQAFDELGRKAFDLIDAGTLNAAELDAEVDQIRRLKAELEPQASAETPRGSTDAQAI